MGTQLPARGEQAGGGVTYYVSERTNDRRSERRDEPMNELMNELLNE